MYFEAFVGSIFPHGNFLQDIQGCDGPLEVLEELNQNVSNKIKAFKSHLEVSDRYISCSNQSLVVNFDLSLT